MQHISHWIALLEDQWQGVKLPHLPFCAGVSVDETLRAIQEADRFPVTQVLEVNRSPRQFLRFPLSIRPRPSLYASLLAYLPSLYLTLFGGY